MPGLKKGRSEGMSLGEAGVVVITALFVLSTIFFGISAYLTRQLKKWREYK